MFKGHLISKGHFGMYPQFFHKTNKKIQLEYYDTSGRLVFVRFFGENCRHQKVISKLTDLYYDINKSTGKQTGKTHLCALLCLMLDSVR